MANRINNYDEIDQINELNGVPIEMIEQRARPGNESDGGFIGAQERFKDVLMRDWRVVQQNGRTHIELANHLRNMIAGVPHAGQREIVYRNNDLGNTENKTGNVFKNFLRKLAFLARSFVLFITCRKTNSKTKNKPNSLVVRHFPTRGLQYDLFRRVEDSREGAWNDHFTITNLKSGESIQFGRGQINYIADYGFYEGGGDQNPYRIDPEKLLRMLRG